MIFIANQIFSDVYFFILEIKKLTLSTQTWNGKWMRHNRYYEKNARTKRTNDQSVRCSVFSAQIVRYYLDIPERHLMNVILLIWQRKRSLPLLCPKRNIKSNNIVCRLSHMTNSAAHYSTTFRMGTKWWSLGSLVIVAHYLSTWTHCMNDFGLKITTRPSGHTVFYQNLNVSHFFSIFARQCMCLHSPYTQCWK